MDKIATLLGLFLVGCVGYVDAPPPAETSTPAPDPIVTTVPEIVEPEITDAALAWERRMELLTGLPRLGSALVAVAVDLINAELAAQGYEPEVVEVPVYLGNPGEIAELAGKPAFGWTPGSAIYMIHAENLCDRPENYDGRMFGWVLTHELLHTVGFEHSVEMTALTNAVWDRWQDHCTSGR